MDLLDEEDAVRLVTTEPAVALRISKKTNVATYSVYFIAIETFQLAYQHLFERTPTTLKNQTRVLTGF